MELTQHSSELAEKKISCQVTGGGGVEFEDLDVDLKYLEYI